MLGQISPKCKNLTNFSPLIFYAKERSDIYSCFLFVVVFFLLFSLFLLFRTTVRLACLMDLINYPMDEQQCPMQISSCTRLLFFPAFPSRGKIYATFDKNCSGDLQFWHILFDFE